MYSPDSFNESNIKRLTDFLYAYPFATLFSIKDAEPYVSHLPFLHQQDDSDYGKLFAHMARANPHWQILESAKQATIIFQGPHSYISPSWYSSPGVPTWNYAVVHVHGTPKIIDDKESIQEIVEKLTAIHESGRDRPWQANFSKQRKNQLLDSIVGFEILITDIKGKFKLSQNRPVEDQINVIKKLQQQNSGLSSTLAELMKSRLNK